MNTYLVMMEKDDYDHEGTVLFTTTDKRTAISIARHIRKNNQNPVWVDRWPLNSTMTYQGVETVWAEA